MPIEQVRVARPGAAGCRFGRFGDVGTMPMEILEVRNVRRSTDSARTRAEYPRR